MIKALSLAAALAVMPMSTALADPDTSAESAAEAAIEAAAERFEARMETFGERADAIAEDESLTEAERKARIAAIWAEYEPDVAAFTAVVSEQAGALVGTVLAEIDIEGVVAEAMRGVAESGALDVGTGVAANGAWASNDPEHMATYGLMAEYAVGEALDEIDAATGGEIHIDLDDDEEEAAEAPVPAPASAD